MKTFGKSSKFYVSIHVYYPLFVEIDICKPGAKVLKSQPYPTALVNDSIPDCCHVGEVLGLNSKHIDCVILETLSNRIYYDRLMVKVVRNAYACKLAQLINLHIQDFKTKVLKLMGLLFVGCSKNLKWALDYQIQLQADNALGFPC